MKIDSHQYFWQIHRGDFGWHSSDTTPLQRDFLPEDLAPLLAQAGIDGTILVQAVPTSADTEFMLSLADCHPFVKGVVGWVDFTGPDAAAEIARLAKHPKLVGLRPMVQDTPDPSWMLRSELSIAFDALVAADLTFDALTLPRHLSSLSELVSRYPSLRVVIEQASKPEIRSGEFSHWALGMERLASSSNVYCKLSGLVTEASENWTLSDLKPYVDHLLEVFGPHRLIWGSDWPLCLLASRYEQWLASAEQLLEGVADTRGIFGGNAQWVYQL